MSYTPPPFGCASAALFLSRAARFLAAALFRALPFCLDPGDVCRYTNIYNSEPSPTNVTHGTIHFIGEYATSEACFAAGTLPPRSNRD